MAHTASSCRTCDRRRLDFMCLRGMSPSHSNHLQKGNRDPSSCWPRYNEYCKECPATRTYCFMNPYSKTRLLLVHQNYGWPRFIESILDPTFCMENTAEQFLGMGRFDTWQVCSSYQVHNTFFCFYAVSKRPQTTHCTQHLGLAAFESSVDQLRSGLFKDWKYCSGTDPVSSI